MSTLLKLTTPIAERIVAVPSGEGFAVRGLNPIHIAALYRRHMGELEQVFESVMTVAKAKGDAQADDLFPLLLGLISETPVLMGELIVIASGGDPASTNSATIVHPATGEPATLPAFDAALLIAMALPIGAQIDALVKVGELTFTPDMTPGKFLALVMALLGKQTTGLTVAKDVLEQIGRDLRGSDHQSGT